MQFIIRATDYTDSEALSRRMAAREAHLDMVIDKRDRGHDLFGAALLDDSGRMIGSLMVVDYPDRAAVDAWLAEEPYITEKVWEKVEVLPCRVAPPFAHLVTLGG